MHALDARFLVSLNYDLHQSNRLPVVRFVDLALQGKSRLFFPNINLIIIKLECTTHNEEFYVLSSGMHTRKEIFPRRRMGKWKIFSVVGEVQANENVIGTKFRLLASSAWEC